MIGSESSSRMVFETMKTLRTVKELQKCSKLAARGRSRGEREVRGEIVSILPKKLVFEQLLF